MRLPEPVPEPVLAVERRTRVAQQAVAARQAALRRPQPQVVSAVAGRTVPTLWEHRGMACPLLSCAA